MDTLLEAVQAELSQFIDAAVKANPTCVAHTLCVCVCVCGD
jgi:hypothetical protein